MRKVGLFGIPAVALLAVAMNTEQMNYRFPAVNAVVRKLTTRLSDVASVKDFGAVCDSGVTDDTVAVNRAIATGVPVLTPATSCRTTGALGTIPGGSVVAKSMSLTTPLPLASGGTGTVTLPPCGAGVVTSDGSKLLCTALSGLAPPGTTGVTLQTVTPGSAQTGHSNLSGTSTATTFSTLSGSSSGGTIQGLGAGSHGGLSFQGTPSLGNAASADIYNFVGGKAAGRYVLNINWDGTAGSGTTSFGFTSMKLSGCGDGAGAHAQPCLYVNDSNAETSALYLMGKRFNNSGFNKVVVTTGNTNVTSGNLFESLNNGVSELALGFQGNLTVPGTVTSAGLTSSGPVSGTTGTFTGAINGTSATFSSGVTASAGGLFATLGISGTSTFSGVAAFPAGLNIGSGGSNITASFRGTVTWNPANLVAQTCAETAITITGAAGGTECAVGSPNPTGGAGVTYTCYVLPNTCNVKACNPTAVTQSVAQGSYSCRVFNP